MNQPLRHITVYFLTGLFLFTTLRAAYGKVADSTTFDIVQSAEKDASNCSFPDIFFEKNSEDEKSDNKLDSNFSHSKHITEAPSYTHHSLYNSSVPIVRLSRLFIRFHKLKIAPF